MSQNLADSTFLDRSCSGVLSFTCHLLSIAPVYLTITSLLFVKLARKVARDC
jgi:hypothetical protein